MRLTDKQEEFCRQVVFTGRLTKAYRLALDASKMSDAAVWVEASRLMNNPKVTLRVEELRQQASAIAERKFGVTVDRIAQELARIAFVDPRDLFDESGNLLPPERWPQDVAAVVSSFEVKVLKGKGARKKDDDRKNGAETLQRIRLAPKIAALELLAKWKEMLIDRVKQGKPGEFDHLNDEEIEKELAAYQKMKATVLACGSRSGGLAKIRD
jgi:phage terminase small subunit